MPPTAPAQLHQQLAERSLVLERELGRGAMATVYLARDLRHERLVAVKVLLPGVPGGTDRFLHEIKLVSPLTHPHIIPIYDSGAVDGTPYFVMPYVAGESLRRRLQREGRLAVDLAVRLASEVGEALQYAHAAGILHRDVKPENILLSVSPDGEPGDVHAFVADFGVARALSRAGAATASAEPDGDRLTRQGVVLGTVEYMSPEQASADPQVDARTDIYSLGCVLYEMLVGTPPFTGESPRDVLARRFREPPPSVLEHRPEVPPPVADAVSRALAADPAERFQSAGAFVVALRSGSAAGPTARPPARARRRAVAAALVVAAGVFAGVHVRLRTRLDPARIVVARLSNETGDSSLAYLGQLAADRITAVLAGRRGLEVVTSATIIPSRLTTGLQVDSLDDPARLRRLADETTAGTLVSGSYFRSARGVSFQAEITNANDGTLLAAVGPVSASTRLAGSAADSLGRRVLEAVRRKVTAGGG